MATKTPLSQGYFATIDDEDVERVSQYRWHAHKSKTSKTIYASGWIDGRTVMLHRFIMDAPKGVQVDHRNGDGLDCQKSNLRFASQLQNARNQGKKSTNTSGYKGVFKSDTRRQAIISVENKLIPLGSFAEKEDAARAYDAAARKYHGEFAQTNFQD